MGRGDRKCAVLGCGNTDVTNCTYTFPSYHDQSSFVRCLKWIQYTGDCRLLEWKPSDFHKRRYYCDVHFDENQYVNPTKRQKVKRNAIPALTLCPEPILPDVIAKYVLKTAPNYKDVLQLLFPELKCGNSSSTGLDVEVAMERSGCAIASDCSVNCAMEVVEEDVLIVENNDFAVMHVAEEVDVVSASNCNWPDAEVDEDSTSVMLKREIVSVANDHCQLMDVCEDVLELDSTSDKSREDVVIVENNDFVMMHVAEEVDVVSASNCNWPNAEVEEDSTSVMLKREIVSVANDHCQLMDVCEDVFGFDSTSNVPDNADVMQDDFCVENDHPVMMEVVEVVSESNCERLEGCSGFAETSSRMLPNSTNSKRINRKCTVKSCGSNNTTHTLFAFPRVCRVSGANRVIENEWLKRCQLWVKFCGEEKVLSKDISSLHKHFYVCAVHFDSRDYYVVNEKMKLRKGAVPTLHGPDPLSEDVVDMYCNSNHVPDGHREDIVFPNIIDDAFVWRGASDKFTDVRSVSNAKLARKLEEVMESFEMKVCPICHEKFMFYPGLKRAHRKSQGCQKFSVHNNMDPGVVPDVLKDLTFVEEQLISRVHPVLSVYKLKGLQYGYRGNVINFFQDVQEFAKQLPHRLEDLSSIITVKFENSRAQSCEFRVRVSKVRDALLWLKENNDYYKEIELSQENLEALPEDGNVFDVINSMSMNENSDDESGDDMCEDDVCENGANNDRVHRSTVPESSFVNQNQQINTVLNWPEMYGDPISESTPGFIVCAFPTLFPFGNCDLRDERGREVKIHEYFKHLLCYEDDRFAKHPTFRFFAFNMWMRHTALTSGNVFVKMDSNLAKMNVEQLKQHIEANPNLMKKLMFMGSNLRGSKSFWKSRSGELRDMVQQLGLPTIFLTMSAADLYWPDLFRLLTGKSIHEIRMSERRKLLQENPLVVDMFFQFRIECFLENVLKPKFGVVDYWYRIEYQHRGSPHLHGLFWLSNAPDVTNICAATDEEKKKIAKYFDKLVCAVMPDKDCPMPNNHPCEVHFEDVTDVKTDISQLLKMVQRHTCSRAYCKRLDKKTKTTRCRFHFPMEIREASELNVNVESGDVEFLPERNDERLNKFNPFIISSWRANIDIAPVLSERAVIEYLTKYVSKCEVGSKTLKDICVSVCASLSDADKAKRAIHRILMKNCVERDISAQEVCHILMGSKLYSSGGRRFVMIYTKNVEWVPLEVNVENEQNDETACNQTSQGKSFIEKYMCRPTHLNDKSMFCIAKSYNVRTWKECRKSNIVRVFPRLSLSGNDEKDEDYYRQQVLLHVHYREESDLRNEDETWKSTYDRHGVADIRRCALNGFNVQPVSDEIVEDDESEGVNNECNEDWMIASRLAKNNSVDSIELGRREVDVQHDWHSNSSKYAAYGDINFFKNFIAEAKKKDDDSFTLTDMPQVEFSKEQIAVKNLMDKQIDALEVVDNPDFVPVPKRILVQGKAGTGKSLLIRYLVDSISKKYGASSVLLLGPTGVSAINVGGATIHSRLNLPRSVQNFKELRGEAARSFCNKMESVKFVIIDEYSMIGCHTMGMIDKRLREGKGINEPMGNLFVYLFGDYKQLPPVRAGCLFGGPVRGGEMAQHGRNVFDSFEKHFVLKQVYRQKDQLFLNLLNRLSNGKLTPEDYRILKKRFTNNVNHATIKKFEDAIRLFSTKDSVKNYNLQKLMNLRNANGDFVPIAKIPAKHHGKGASLCSPDDADGLHAELYLGVGTRVMLRSNVWVRKGLVNGALGTVVDLLYDTGKQSPNDAPSVIMVKFDAYLGPGIGPENVVPVTSVVRSWTVKGSSVSCSRQQFPMVVSYACTIHKSQGLTLDQAVIDIGSTEFSLGITYVGLSRVKSLDGLLLHPASFERFAAIAKRTEFGYRKDFEVNVLGCV